MEPDVLDLVPRGATVSVEREVFPRLIGDGLFAQSETGHWIDIGTPESYLAANLRRCRGEGWSTPRRPSSRARVWWNRWSAPVRWWRPVPTWSGRCSCREPGSAARLVMERVVGMDGEFVW